MKIYQGLDHFNRLEKAVVTSGFFDGVHKGHQKVLSRVAQSAKDAGGESVVLTFWPHPRTILNPQGEEIKVITTLKEKINLIATCGIDHLIIIPFTREFSILSSDEFVRKILLDKIGTKKLIIGYDHRFGKNREGSFEYLRENCSEIGFDVEEIPREDVKSMGVSSTLIRNAILEGDVTTATTFLGRNYSLEGLVVEGKKLGRTIGFPTANIHPLDATKIIPKDGIYAVRAEVKGIIYNGMLSIGYNPTVDGTTKTIEVHIFNFNEVIYGKTIRIFFIKYLREEEKFDSLELMIDQLKKDQENSLSVLSDS